MTPITHDVRFTTNLGVRTERWELLPDGTLGRFLGYVTRTPPPQLPAHQVSILPDGQYLCDAGRDMPDLYAASAGAAGSEDIMPAGDHLPHSLPLLDPEMERRNPANSAGSAPVPFPPQ